MPTINVSYPGELRRLVGDQHLCCFESRFDGRFLGAEPDTLFGYCGNTIERFEFDAIDDAARFAQCVYALLLGESGVPETVGKLFHVTWPDTRPGARKLGLIGCADGRLAA